MALAARDIREDDNLLPYYTPLPTCRRFHESPAQIRCIVGPVGSGKTTAASWELGYYLPLYILQHFHKRHSRWVIVRNSYKELTDTTQKTFFSWFPWGNHQVSKNEYTFKWPEGMEVEVLFRSCDNPKDVKKFKSLEVNGYWIDESIELDQEVRKMLKGRIGRFSDPRRKIPARWGIETTNPPDVEHPVYYEFAWETPPPGPVPVGSPLKNHAGFWQPPYENAINLRPGYYDDLREDYRDSPDWADMYIEGKPGILIRGKLVYANFRREIHVAKEALSWSGGTIYRGWDNTGNMPACLVAQVPTAGQIQILREFYSDRLGIVDFTRNVIANCNILFPGASYQDWADPAGESKFSKPGGGFTSNAQLMRETGVDAVPSDQNFTARVSAIDQQLARIDGCLIDPSCIRFINGFLGGYCYPEIKNIRGVRFDEKPLKNRFSHIHDAGQYLFTGLFGSAAGKGQPYIPPGIEAYDIYSDEMG